MNLIRKTEEKLIFLHPEQEMKTPFHLYIGQEAIAAGVCGLTSKKDLVFSYHRSHGHYLAKGGNLNQFFAEMYNKSTGCSAGKGGSMHLIDTSVGHMGSSSIVAGSIPIAVGASLALKKKKSKNVVISFFGDGAVDEGVLYESFNFASLHSLNIIFVCENNSLSVHTPLSTRRLKDNLIERSKSFGLFSKRVDGNDVIKVNDLYNSMRKKQIFSPGPCLMECDTYRMKGHIGINEDLISGVRDKLDIIKWKKKCPINRLEYELINKYKVKEKKLIEIKKNINSQISKSVNFGKLSSLPKKTDLLKGIFA